MTEQEMKDWAKQIIKSYDGDKTKALKHLNILIDADTKQILEYRAKADVLITGIAERKSLINIIENEKQ